MFGQQRCAQPFCPATPTSHLNADCFSRIMKLRGGEFTKPFISSCVSNSFKMWRQYLEANGCRIGDEGADQAHGLAFRLIGPLRILAGAAYRIRAWSNSCFIVRPQNADTTSGAVDITTKAGSRSHAIVENIFKIRPKSASSARPLARGIFRSIFVSLRSPDLGGKSLLRLKEECLHRCLVHPSKPRPIAKRKLARKSFGIRSRPLRQLQMIELIDDAFALGQVFSQDLSGLSCYVLIIAGKEHASYGLGDSRSLFVTGPGPSC